MPKQTDPYERLKQGILSLDDKTLQAIYDKEATITVNKKINNSVVEVPQKMLSKNQLIQIRKQLLEEIESEEFKNNLMKNNFVKIKKDEKNNLPRSLTIITLDNGQYGVVIETKRHLESEEMDKQINKRAQGGFKHGTPCILFWPRKKGKPNKLWWNSVQEINRNNKLSDAQQEAKTSQQNFPFIHSEIIGEVFDGNKVNTYAEASIYGDFSSHMYDKDDKPKSNKKYSDKDADRIITSFLLGIQHLHHQIPPVIQRDIKPQNILVFKDSKGKFFGKVADFGVSHKDPVGIDGTASHMPPESYAKASEMGFLYDDYKNTLGHKLYGDTIKVLDKERNKAATIANDTWAIGVLLYETYTNQSDEDFNLLKKYINKESDEYKALVEKINPTDPKNSTATEKEKMWYIMANCLQLEKDRFTIDQVINALPNQKLVKEFQKVIKLNSPKKEAIKPVEKQSNKILPEGALNLNLAELYQNKGEEASKTLSKPLFGFRNYTKKEMGAERKFQIDLLQKYVDEYNNAKDGQPKLDAAANLKAAITLTRDVINSESHLIAPTTINKVVNKLEAEFDQKQLIKNSQIPEAINRVKQDLDKMPNERNGQISNSN